MIRTFYLPTPQYTLLERVQRTIFSLWVAQDWNLWLAVMRRQFGDGSLGGGELHRPQMTDVRST